MKFEESGFSSIGFLWLNLKTHKNSSPVLSHLYEYKNEKSFFHLQTKCSCIFSITGSIDSLMRTLFPTKLLKEAKIPPPDLAGGADATVLVLELLAAFLLPLLFISESSSS